MAQTRPSPTLSRGFTRLGRFLAPYDVAAGGTQPKHQEPWEHNPVTTDPAASEFHLDRTVVAPASRKGFHPVHIPEPLLRPRVFLDT